MVPHHFLAGAPSVLFDAIVLAPSEGMLADLLAEPAAIDWVRDAYAHAKVIGYTRAAVPLLEQAGIDLDAADEGIVDLEQGDFSGFVEPLRGHRIWARERA